jgi:hypothetical protein
MLCTQCEAPQRKLWPPSSAAPKLAPLDTGSWIDLKLCGECRTLWTVVPWEPHASFPYAIGWPHSPEDWRVVHDLDDGRTLSAWHERQVRLFVRSLVGEDLLAVRAHQARSCGRSPLDESQRIDLQTHQEHDTRTDAFGAETPVDLDDLLTRVRAGDGK